MKRLFFLSLVFFALTTVNAQTKWTTDNAHSNIRFTVAHLVISEVEGNFKAFNGTITSTNADFDGAKIEFSVDVKSINTENEMRDTHLKSDDFFNAEKYPQMTFKSVSFKKVSGNKYKLTGNLTIRDVTRSVTFDVTYGGTANDGYGNTKAGFKATAVIDRLDYNLKWNKLTETGGSVVGKDITIDLKLEFAKAK
jgi:polyisoprenoid-binding protein YceI